MIVQSNVDIPSNLYQGLSNGSLVREGSVVRHAIGTEQGGSIVALLREAALSPNPIQNIVSSNLMNVLNFATFGTSLLNLGATISFGMMTLNKLDTVTDLQKRTLQKLDGIDKKLDGIDKKLDGLDEKLDEIKWIVELNFAHTLQILENSKRIKHYLERQILADLISASNLAWGAQTLEPGSHLRMIRMENALTLATTSANNLKLQSLDELSRISDVLNNREINVIGDRLINPTAIHEAIDEVDKFRKTCLACALKAGIEAETGGIEGAANNLYNDYVQLKEMLSRIALTFFRPKNFFTYDYLVQRYWKGKIQFSQILRLAKRYDSEIKTADDIVELLMENNYKDHHSIDQKPANWGKWMDPVGGFFTKLEEATEDLERLSGYVGEYQLASKMNLSLDEYRKTFQINELPSENKLVFFTLKEGDDKKQ